jgi:hypothetical protein
MYFEKTFPPMLCLDMNGNFQLKKSLVYQLILNVSRNTLRITIWALQWKSGKKCMLDVNFKRTQYSTHRRILYWFFCYINKCPTTTINPKTWQLFVHMILKFFSPLLIKHICIMGFMMITQHNAWWHDALIHCDFNTLQSKMKIIIIVKNIYC